MPVRHIWYSKNCELPELPELYLEPQWSTGLNCVENKLILDFLCKKTKLENREKQVFHMRFILEMTLEEIGEKLALSRSMIKYIEMSIVRKMRLIAVKNGIIPTFWSDYEFH